MKVKKAVFLVVLLGVAAGITAFVAAFAEKKEKTGDMVCVTSFYPVYLLAESVAEGAEGVQVQNLTENHSGCIHDYTLTTQDMRLLTEAKLFFVNGGGMEMFLTKVAEDYKGIKMVDTSEGFAFLEGVEHTHAHGEEAEEGFWHTVDKESDAEHSHEVNAHIWLDIDGYLWQLSRVEEAFVAADPAQEELYRANAQQCREELLRLKKDFEAAKKELSDRETVVFHEGFVYLFSMLGIETLHCLPMDGDTQIAAGEAAEIVDECLYHGVTRLFTEAAYVKTVEHTFLRSINGEVIVLDSITGEKEQTEAPQTGVVFYCERMRENLETIKQAYEVQ